jgi:uncharacterized protein YbaR (Trm112 family)
MKLNLFSLIEDLINEHGSSSILRERLLLLKEELAKVENERTSLITKVAELEKQLSNYREQLNKATVPKEFTEYMGALYKRDMNNRYMPMAFCPECKRPLVGMPDPDIFPYRCSGCGYEVMIHDNLTSIAEKLNKKTS